MAAEVGLDQLPAVPTDLRQVLHNAPTTPPPPPAAGESAAALLPHGKNHGPLAALESFLSSRPVMAVEGLLLLIALLRLRLRIRRRRRRRRYSHYQGSVGVKQSPAPFHTDTSGDSEDERVFSPR